MHKYNKCKSIHFFSVGVSSTKPYWYAFGCSKHISAAETQNEVDVELEVDVANEVEVKLNQTKLNWAVTQLKLKLVYV